MLYNNVLETIGHTPIVKLNSLDIGTNKIYAKLEYFNPSSSIKDRPALHMVEQAERSGTLTHRKSIIEATSGNMGISLAMVAAVKKYACEIVMPATTSLERQKAICAFGANIILIDGSMADCVTYVKRRCDEFINNYWSPIQFSNQANSDAHKETANEIWRDTEGNIDYLVAGVGTGGTLTGIAKYLKNKNHNIKVVAVEPEESNVLSGGKPNNHAITGIGSGFVPEILDTRLLDEVISIDANLARRYCNLLSKHEGIFAGYSSGAACAASVKLANRAALQNQVILTVFPDGGDRYLTSGLYSVT